MLAPMSEQGETSTTAPLPGARRRSLVEVLDDWGHSSRWCPAWLSEVLCDATDISLGLVSEDFLTNDGAQPSRLAYLLARLG